jgi:hypothetical protein
MLTGGAVSEIDCVQKGLRTVSARNDVEQAIFPNDNPARRPAYVQNRRRRDKSNQIYESRELFGGLPLTVTSKAQATLPEVSTARIYPIVSLVDVDNTLLDDDGL